MNLYALIMAGGVGKRFWPLSRKDNPKQFLSLIGGKSMIRLTVDRILPLVPPERIFIVTISEYADLTLEHVPELPPENVLIEPEGKNTAPCVAFGTLKIKSLTPDATVVVLPADHAIGHDAAFRESIKFGYEVANTELPTGEFPLVTLGVEPGSAETGYGYIKDADVTLMTLGKLSAKKVERFIEKPELETAINFLEEGGYYWNSGIFLWKASSIIDEFSEILPAWHEHLDEVLRKIGSSDEDSAVYNFYHEIESGPIDKLILEKSKNTVVIPIDFPWSDVGNWKALDDFLRNTEDENIYWGKLISLDSSSCLTVGDRRLIAVLGVQNLVVVETDDAVLVLDKSRAQDVKELVDMLGSEK